MTSVTAPSTRARAQYRELHRSGCFVLPNPWDIGSARYLARTGFRAIATTSAGFAWSQGCQDNRVTLDMALAHFTAMAASVEIPVNADFQGAFAVDPRDVAANVRRAAATGVAGISVEDSTNDAAAPLHDFELAVERVRAACEVVAGTGIVLTARSEGFIAGRPDIDETIRRLRAFADAGADCLYAPGIRERDHIAAVVRAVAPKPVNVLVGTGFTSVARLAELGVRRISVGGALARVAWGAFMRAAQEIAEAGTFEGLTAAPPYGEVDRLFE